MRFRSILPILLLSARAWAGASYGTAQPFQAGDTVCFVGDSITHSGTYHSIVELFYATRFPDRSIQYFNDGIGGDRAQGIMSDERYRLNTDILSHHPTVATIMLGMNDVGRNNYGPGKTGPDFDQKHQASLDAYSENMQALIHALQNSGARLILIEPSIYEETTTSPNVTSQITLGSNGALGKCSKDVEQWSKQYHTGLVNFYGVMSKISRREQKSNPQFSLVGQDRVHPGAVGHFVMAYAFLKAQGMPRDVATMRVDGRKGKAGNSANSEIDHVEASKSGVEFDSLEKALPFVVPEAAQPALKLVPFKRDLNREELIVSHLRKGHYALTIDGEAVGEYSAAELQKGIDLAENPKTPQYRQSGALTAIAVERQKTGSLLRDVVLEKYSMSRRKIDPFNLAAVEKEAHRKADEDRQGGKPEDRRLKVLLQDLAEPGALQRQFDEQTKSMLAARHPKKHHFSLKNVASGSNPQS